MPKQKVRCPWPGDDDLMIAYHDIEWGVPVYSDKKIFEFLILESAQAGLSWRTILHKRGGYKKAFANFDPKKVASFGQREINKLLKNPEIVRNRLKILATINNAQRFLEVQKEFGSFSDYMWSFVDNVPLDGKRKALKDLPSITKEAERFSKDLKQRGFAFLGPTVIYAHMQAVGMVNDHLMSCYRYKEIQRMY